MKTTAAFEIFHLYDQTTVGYVRATSSDAACKIAVRRGLADHVDAVLALATSK